MKTREQIILILAGMALMELIKYALKIDQNLITNIINQIQ
jgi:hypothetical protein